MAAIKRVVWDTNVAIDLLDDKHGKPDEIIPFIEDAENGKLEILFPETSVVELRNLRGLREQGKSAKEIKQIINYFLSQSYILRRPLHRHLANLASDIVIEHNIQRAADAVVVALAVQEGVTIVHTSDKGILKLDGKLGDPSITICEPNHRVGTLFENTTEN